MLVYFEIGWSQRNHRAPDLKHKVTGEALWIFNPSTPQWVKAMLIEVNRGGRRRFGGSGVRGFHAPLQFDRYFYSDGYTMMELGLMERRSSHLEKGDFI